jgi:8-oxo-dGTP pyrophosphatase MutT (NUDIX family)
MIATVSSCGAESSGRMGEDRGVTDPKRLPLPAAMVQRARDFRGTPAPVRDAATVVLLRPDPVQVYVLRRATTMVFGGVYAFPGGGVDPSDRPETIRTDWPERLGVPAERAAAVVGAAARELFEEAGVLLAGREDATVGDVSGPEWEADRLAVQNRELTMTELLRRRGLRLRDDLLFPWSRWITPEFEPRRFDTWFFVALLPEAQTARDVSGEADATEWVAPGDAGHLRMLPPTRSTLNDLSAFRSLPEVVAAAERRDAATPVMPRVELTGDGGAVLHLP